MREMRNYRLVVIAVAIGVTLVFGVLAVFVAESLLLLLPLMLMLWFIWFMPWWRRRIRRKARSLPEWQLTPE